MELDLYKNDGSILYSTYGYLGSTNGETDSILVTSRSAISSFVQVKSVSIVFVASELHCIKVLSRDGNRLRTLAGTCGTSGYVEGGMGTGRLYWPWGIDVDIRNPNKLLITDTNNNALRSVDLRTGELDTVINTGLDRPYGMLWVKKRLLVTNAQYISEVSWFNNGTVVNALVAGSKDSNNTNPSSDEPRFLSLLQLLEVREDLYLTADYGPLELRLLDLEQQRLGLVCADGEYPCSTGSTISSTPTSLLKEKNSIYVGMKDGIYKFSGISLSTNPVCPYSNVTVNIQPDKETADVELYCGNTAVLPTGIYQFERRHDSYVCTYYVHVLSPSVVRTLVFKAEYEVRCKALSIGNTREIFQSVLLQRRNQLQNNICNEDCTMSSTRKMSYTCVNNHLTVYWSTEEVFNGNESVVPAQLTTLLKERLNTNSGMCSEIVIVSQNPVLVEAKKNSRGESIQIELSSSCSNKKMSYRADLDACI